MATRQFDNLIWVVASSAMRINNFSRDRRPVKNGGADSFDPVGHHGLALAAATQYYAGPALAAGNCPGGRVYKVRVVVTRIKFFRPIILEVMPLSFQEFLDFF